MFRLEETPADLVPKGRVLVHAEGGETAVAGDLGGDPLLDKRLEVLFCILPVIEKVVVRMRIDEARADLQSRQIHHLVRLHSDVFADICDPVVLDQDISDPRFFTGTVDDGSVFEQGSQSRQLLQVF